nr:hypothetical protein GCM10020093_011320 [Planobispora longispora]
MIQLRLLFNPGAAFSIGEGATWVFTLVAVAVVAGIAHVGRRLRSTAWTVALGALLGGAASHLLDRLFRPPGFARGHVVDFIDYGGLFVGNLADIALVGSCASVMLLSARGISSAAHRTGASTPPPPPGALRPEHEPTAWSRTRRTAIVTSDGVSRAGRLLLRRGGRSPWRPARDN